MMMMITPHRVADDEARVPRGRTYRANVLQTAALGGVFQARGAALGGLPHLLLQQLLLDGCEGAVPPDPGRAFAKATRPELLAAPPEGLRELPLDLAVA